MNFANAQEKVVTTDNVRGISVTGIVSAIPVSEVFKITADGALHFRVDVHVTDVTQVGTLTLKMQHRSASTQDWTDTKSVTVTADGWVTLTFLVEAVADQTYLPLRPQGRIVLTTTNAGDEVTVASVLVVQAIS